MDIDKKSTTRLSLRQRHTLFALLPENEKTRLLRLREERRRASNSDKSRLIRSVPSQTPTRKL